MRSASCDLRQAFKIWFLCDSHVCFFGFYLRYPVIRSIPLLIKQSSGWWQRLSWGYSCHINPFFCQWASVNFLNYSFYIIWISGIEIHPRDKSLWSDARFLSIQLSIYYTKWKSFFFVLFCFFTRTHISDTADSVLTWTLKIDNSSIYAKFIFILI